MAKWMLIPNAITLLGLQLPYPLGVFTVAGALVSALYLDLVQKNHCKTIGLPLARPLHGNLADVGPYI